MKKSLYASLFLIVFGVPAASSGFKMGLGHAVAETGTKVFKQAAETDRLNSTGDNVAQLMAPCGETLPYSISPIVVTDIQGIDPLGHVNPPGHTFPSDHIYFYIVPVDTTSSVGPRVVTNVLAPGDIRISDINYSYVNGNPATTDYGVIFWGCRELQSYFGHVRTLSASLLAQLNNTPQSCQDYSTGGSLFHRCDAQTNIFVSAGDVIGTAGGSSAALDFGSYDYRRTPIPFISPARHPGSQPLTVCPIDYFESTLKATLESHLGRFDGGYKRTVAPVCGEINYDLANTAQGNWYHIGSPDNPEDPHLSLKYDNVYAARQEISVGTSVPGVSPTFYSFDQLSSGTHNRDFSTINAGPAVYCYDTFFDPIGQAATPGFGFLITMPTATTIRVEKNSAFNCGTGPWTMGSNYAEFQR